MVSTSVPTTSRSRRPRWARSQRYWRCRFRSLPQRGRNRSRCRKRCPDSPTPAHSVSGLHSICPHSTLRRATCLREGLLAPRRQPYRRKRKRMRCPSVKWLSRLRSADRSVWSGPRLSVPCFDHRHLFQAVDQGEPAYCGAETWARTRDVGRTRKGPAGLTGQRRRQGDPRLTVPLLEARVPPFGEPPSAMQTVAAHRRWRLQEPLSQERPPTTGTLDPVVSRSHPRRRPRIDPLGHTRRKLRTAGRCLSEYWWAEASGPMSSLSLTF